MVDKPLESMRISIKIWSLQDSFMIRVPDETLALWKRLKGVGSEAAVVAERKTRDLLRADTLEGSTLISSQCAGRDLSLHGFK